MRRQKPRVRRTRATSGSTWEERFPARRTVFEMTAKGAGKKNSRNQKPKGRRLLASAPHNPVGDCVWLYRGEFAAVAVAELLKRMTPEASVKKWRTPVVFTEIGSALTV